MIFSQIEAILLLKLYAAQISPPNQFPAFWLGGVASSSDEDEVVPGSFHICGIKINHPHPAYRAPGRMTPP